MEEKQIPELSGIVDLEGMEFAKIITGFQLFTEFFRPTCLSGSDSMRLKEFLRLKNLFGLAILFALVVGCDDSNPLPTKSTPPLVLSVSSPYRMVEYDADSLLVSDARRNAVHFVDKESLEPTESVRTSGRPSAISHYGGLLYVGNLTTGSVDALNEDGELQFYLGGAQGLFQQVNDLAIDQSAGLVYVLDSKAALVRIYNASDGSDTGLVIGSGVLIRPTALEVDQVDGRLFVSEYGPDPQIRVFNNNGSQNVADPILGSSVGFSMPQGIFIDSDENVFLVESRLGEIRILDSNHLFVKALGTPSDQGVRELYYPLDVFVDANSKDVYVTDNQNQRIVVYLGGGTVP